MNYTARLHKIIFLSPLLFLVCIIVLNYWFPGYTNIVLVFYVFDLFWFLFQWILYQFSTITVTDKNVTMCRGFLVRQTMDISLNSIESVDVTQSVIGALLNYGEISIRGTGGTVYGMSTVKRPLMCRRMIEQVRHE